jgi:hypothetical protein
MDILGIGKMVAGVAGKFIESKDNKNKRIHEENMADGQRITGMDENDAAYAISKLKEQQGTWKDEVALLTILIPAWLAFIKIGSFDGPAIVSAGMIALDATPIWYQALLSGGITGALGMNEYAKHQKRSRLSVSKVTASDNH